MEWQNISEIPGKKVPAPHQPHPLSQLLSVYELLIVFSDLWVEMKEFSPSSNDKRQPVRFGQFSNNYLPQQQRIFFYQHRL